MGQLQTKVKNEGIMVLYQGALANALASFVGSYPWYFVFNALQESIPMAPAGVVWMKLCRHALCGFGATCVSDCVSNVIRVLKTTVQTAEVSITYTEAAKQVIDKEGVIGLVTRGLKGQWSGLAKVYSSRKDGSVWGMARRCWCIPLSPACRTLLMYRHQEVCAYLSSLSRRCWCIPL